MHIGGVALYEDSLTFAAFYKLLDSRLHIIPKLQQRLVKVPLSLDRPYWVDDPDFYLDWHLHHTALPSPGDWPQLSRLASRLFSQPLDKSRPLWEMIFVEGVDSVPHAPPGSVAIISKIHHALIDGISGSDVMGLLLDAKPEPRSLPPPQPRQPDPVPGDVELVLRSTYHFATRPFKLPRLLAETAKATLKAGYLTRVQGVRLPSMPFTAPPTRFNKPITRQRVWDSLLLPLDSVKMMRQAVPEATVNDIILAICSGALRRYLAEKRELPAKSLVAMMPISIRSRAEKNKMGNQVAAMLTQLATDVADPVARLKRITSNTQRAKTYQKAVDARTLVNYGELVPFGLAGLAARLYSRMGVARRHRPIFNLIITNIPGPQVPLYLAGARLLANMGMAPIGEGLGLIVTVFSYNGLISISPMSCPQIMPDIDLFTRYLGEAAQELATAVHPPPPEKLPAKQTEPRRCRALTKAGSRCRNHPQNGSPYCYQHRSRAKNPQPVLMKAGSD